ncbi:MAG: 30S ribosomal protein S2 [candidate division BRC1 bacterium ADurb.Bin183]|nr:MAG: 30S ribosomal protein S2 [candidate division BRC1 bacterium ADurb.Bin183]
MEEKTMTESVTMKQLLEAGVHFGHQSRRWNPKMARYIFTERNGIYIIDLKKTLRLLREAMKFVRENVAKGKKVLFVGTKKQARESIEQAAKECGMYYVNNRWLGGMMTNFSTVKKSINRLIELERMIEDDTIKRYTKKEISRLDSERESLSKNLAGVKSMTDIPGILFIVDPHKEEIAVREAKKLNIPVVAVVDTNCDPDPIDYVIPGNDDAIRAIKLMADQIKLSCIEGLMEHQAISGVNAEGITPEIAATLGIPLPPDAKTAAQPVPPAESVPADAPADEAQAEPVAADSEDAGN